MLDKAGIRYEELHYTIDKDLFNGEAVSDLLGLEYSSCYKTLGVRHDHDVYICVIPVDRELDLKKTAKGIGVKNVEMIHVKDLLKLVGYERGSVSPIGVKKNKGIWFDEEVMDHEKIEISAGEFGTGLIVDRKDLLEYLKAGVTGLVKENE